ncbi:hypothetical protein Afil01_25580 [Actinorhabdospora filicis]|uniref:Uncharacterized protein n=1 Tax=Actinorhabdospora filicis TaxID=1785913 RepID=A0A9W6W9P1_9ACTN|nr:hypothetical protein [Actinorhabdospora filicis]GLZ77751.1 hypothetical protein Afil01_25580 [Actinorhabdospora filicis]
MDLVRLAGRAASARSSRCQPTRRTDHIFGDAPGHDAMPATLGIPLGELAYWYEVDGVLVEV